MTLLTKINRKLYVFFQIQTRRLAAYFEHLNSSLARSAGEWQWCKVMAK